MTFYFETYGCQMNIAESTALQLTLEKFGWQEQKLCAKARSDSSYNLKNSEVPDLIIINTCSVRITAEERVFGRLRFYTALKKNIHKTGKKIFILVTGCMADRLGSKLIEKGADYILSTQHKQLFPSILSEIQIECASECAEIKEHQIPSATNGLNFLKNNSDHFVFSDTYYSKGSFRSFVPIMHGCNNFCSYCIVPYVRGNEVSRNPLDIICEIRMLSDHGVKEITLLGQNVNSYIWKDYAAEKTYGRNSYLTNKNLDFSGLLELIAETIYTECLSIEWVRFLSSHPKDLSLKTIDVISKNKIFCKHLHLCVQHGSNNILLAMNRRYTREQYLRLVNDIKTAIPDITLSTDILVGFPGESASDFEEVLTLMESVRFLYSYMYHYNPREGTAAFNFSGRIDEGEKIARLGRVIELQQQHTRSALNIRVGSVEKVLVENVSRNNQNELVCRSERDESVIAAGDKACIGTFANVKIEGVKGNTLHGHFVTA
ncbi:tRNA-2-methylthio-N(6)-dimethylallyladenosine synthase [Spirochaetia bacterium]|nr:tRNA-2-methylthio-N(6)-dimethylallyladenosine synthase [Spirochaetia bacterium]